LIGGERKAETAEQLMRSRYSAYTQVEMDYLLATLHPDKRAEHDEESARQWASDSQWHGLEIRSAVDGGEDDAKGSVEFVAEFTYDGERQVHHENAFFSKEDGQWYFVEGEPVKTQPFVREAPKVGRNEPCPCGSGEKFKRCCG